LQNQNAPDTYDTVRASQVKAAAARIPEFRKMTPEQHEDVAQAVKAGTAKK
jgi:hypothetical protein